MATREEREERFARTYDASMAVIEKAFLADVRGRLLADVTGDVVEIGAGTGGNLPYYAGARTVHLVEPSAPMRDVLAGTLGNAPSVTVVDAPAERLPLPDLSADVVVSTLVLCSVEDVDRALAEVRRVLRPDGRFLFLEHGRRGGLGGTVQHALTPMWSHYTAGCRLDRDLDGAIRRAGFAVDDIEIRAPWWVRVAPPWPMSAGRAVPTS